MADHLFGRVALIGVGLIGSSLAHAMRRGKLANHIAAHAKTRASRETIKRLGLTDSVHETAAAAVEDADLAILCIPVGECGKVAKEIGGHLKSGAILTDVGSVKGAVLRDVAPHVPAGVHFIPGHPIAGTEQSGPLAGFAELFDSRWCILTPPEGHRQKIGCTAGEFLAGLRVERRDHGCRPS
jgi:cyclohexadieny/prephenate dehydrogenase